MPELPEVETIARQFRTPLLGRRIVAFESRWPRQASPSVAGVRRGVVGRTIASLGRRAKFLVFALDDGAALLVHLRMSGRLEWLNGSPEPAHVRAVWTLDDQRRFALCDARKFGRIVYAADPAAATRGLGVEPLERSFTPRRLAELLRGRSRRLKPLLLDQTLIAGLGNIYTDEALFRAGLHPLARSDRLADAECGALHEAIRFVLRQGIRHNGTSIDWIYPDGRMQEHLFVYGRTGEPCRRCGTAIEALRVGQRGTHVCPRCQRRRVGDR